MNFQGSLIFSNDDFTLNFTEKFRLIAAVKKHESEEVDLALQCCIRVIEDVGKEAARMIAQSPRNIELCLSTNFSTRVLSRTFELISTMFKNNVVPDLNWTVVLEKSQKYEDEFEELVSSYHEIPEVYQKTITPIFRKMTILFFDHCSCWSNLQHDV